MSRASALIVATLGAASAVGEAQVCTPNSGGGGLVYARDSAMLQARAKKLNKARAKRAHQKPVPAGVLGFNTSDSAVDTATASTEEGSKPDEE